MNRQPLSTITCLYGIWPVGQVVKTEASHAFNIGSNPVRVTTSEIPPHGSETAVAFGGCRFFGCASGLLLFPTRPAALGSRGVPVLSGFRKKTGCFVSKSAQKTEIFLHFGLKAVWVSVWVKRLTHTRPKRGNDRKAPQIISVRSAFRIFVILSRAKNPYLSLDTTQEL